MRDFLKSSATPAIGLLSFAATVSGHVALKIAVVRTVPGVPALDGLVFVESPANA